MPAFAEAVARILEDVSLLWVRFPDVTLRISFAIILLLQHVFLGM